MMKNLTPVFLSILSILSIAVLSAAAPVSADDAPWKWGGENLDGWQAKKKDAGSNAWVIGDPSLSSENEKTFAVGAGGDAMINKVNDHGQGWDIYSKKKFGDCRIEIEVMVPKGANSGIYVMGEYEVQVLDSYGKKEMGPGDMGAIYGASPPPVNASKMPGKWQKYIIEWTAPKFGADGEKTANARFVKVELNGKTLHENLEMPAPTPGGVTGKEAAEGPVMFQGDHGPVAYRNITITPLKK